MKFTDALKRLTCIALCAVILAALFPAPASALSKTVYVTDLTANVYASYSTSSKVIASVSFGQPITCTAVSGKWARVTNRAGKIGYMAVSALSQSNPNTLNKKIYIQKAGLKVYINASTASAAMASLKLGSSYTAVAISPNGQWLRIKNGKYCGYVQTVYTDTSPYKQGTRVYMAESNIAVTGTPGNSYSIGMLSLGQSCWLLEKNSKYAKVRSAGGVIGYINDPSVLSVKDTNTLNRTMYVQADNASLYPHAITRTRAGALNKNAAVTVLARHVAGNMEWYRVKYNGRYYYMPGILLADSKAPSGGRTVYAHVARFAADQELTLPVYENPSWSSTQVAKVVDGTKLILVSYKGMGVRVRTPDGKLGYVMPTQLRKNP